MTRGREPEPTPPTWHDTGTALAALAARDARRGVGGLYSRWRSDPAGHAVTALTTVLALAVMVLARGVAASADGPALIPDADVAATAGAEWAARQTTVPGAEDTPEPGRETGALPAWGAGLPAGVVRWRAEIEASAAKHDVSPRLIACVMAQESVGRTDALSSAGASGLMQVHPPSHPSYDVARGVREPAYAVDYGVAYLASLLKATGGDVTDALGRYNGGQGWRQFAESNTYVRVVGACNDRGA